MTKTKGRTEVFGRVYAQPCERPGFIPKGRPRGAKRHGLQYEAAFAGAVHGVHGQWFQVRDDAGAFWCQSDVLIGLEWGPDAPLVVAECKYTWVPGASEKIMAVYGPVLRAAYGRPVLGLVVCRNLVPGIKAPVRIGLREAIMASRLDQPAVLHWTGSAVLNGARAGDLRNVAQTAAQPRALALCDRSPNERARDGLALWM